MSDPSTLTGVSMSRLWNMSRPPKPRFEGCPAWCRMSFVQTSTISLGICGSSSELGHIRPSDRSRLEQPDSTSVRRGRWSSATLIENLGMTVMTSRGSSVFFIGQDCILCSRSLVRPVNGNPRRNHNRTRNLNPFFMTTASRQATHSSDTQRE